MARGLHRWELERANRQPALRVENKNSSSMVILVLATSRRCPMAFEGRKAVENKPPLFSLDHPCSANKAGFGFSESSNTCTTALIPG
ncbi:hypothetical protein M404DRAFT_891148 [Pisolithus tinctorius Marx 270]|uniref:Uncharacterized protein n=1 Tax=Pisolithus tinctorius Marx 270 TaxID=870435 RepID=A0A0C3JIZ6_PISTI|nr:hypothetical protein M404DRAFT_891148 [Pisolithus tinctorius Marx 270]